MNGYVRMPVLMAAHPGWREVQELNSALNGSEIARPAVASAQPAAPKAYPPPLDTKSGAPQKVAVDEAQRIEAIRDPALARIERLKRTSGLRMERNITRNQADVDKNMKARLAENAQRLTQQNTDEKAAIRKAAHANIRDLGLQEIALSSQLDSYAMFPGVMGAVRAEAQRNLADATAKRKAAESELADKLKAADDRYKQRLSASEERISEEAETEAAEFKYSEQKRVTAEVSRNKKEVETVLEVLAPLESPLAVKSAPVKMRFIPPIVAKRGSPVPAATSESSVRNIREQRDRLVEFIRQDIMRRIARLSSTNHWNISTTYSPFLPDKSKEVSDLLKVEWTP